MSRFVEAKPKGLRTASASATGSIPKEATERIAKYVPAEVLAAYTSINGLFINSEEEIKFWGMFAATSVLWLLTPFYFKWIKKPEDEPSFAVQQWVSSIAFIIWAYTISGESGIFGKDGFNIFRSEIASAIMIVFSLISAAIIPRK